MDNGKAFNAALERQGYVLARGDRRGFVVVDRHSDVHSLTRYVKGHKAKDIKSKISDLDPLSLPSVDEAKELQKQRSKAIKEGEDERQKNYEKWLSKRQLKLRQKHAQDRLKLRIREQDLLVRQQAERLQLHAAQTANANRTVFQARTAVAEFIKRTPGLRSVLKPLQKFTGLDPREKHARERDALVQRHARERKEIERLMRFQKRIEIREMKSLELQVMKEHERILEAKGNAKADFTKAANPEERIRTDMEDGDLRIAFNDAADFVEGGVEAGEDDRNMSWKERAEDLRQEQEMKKSAKRGFDRERD